MLSPLLVAVVFAAQASEIAAPHANNGVAPEVTSQSGIGVPPSDPAAGSDGGEIVVTATHHATGADPLAHVNEKSFEATQAVGKPFGQPAYTAPTGVVSALDNRAEFDQQLRAIRELDDPYLARRTLYLRKRQAEINGLHNYKQHQT